MTITIKPRNADRARELKSQNPFMTAGDISALTRIPMVEVKNALIRRPKSDKRKSRAR